MTQFQHPAAIYERQLENSLEGKYLKVAQLLNPSSNILELGCSTGYFAGALTRLGHKVTGLEADPDAVELCQQRGINALVTDLSKSNPLSCVQEVQFDAVLCMDILEHLPNPESLLRDVKSVLKPDGQLIITGPNVAYWSVRLHLLMGRWDYSRAGIMDETHLRWFTRRTWTLLLKEAGFNIRLADSAEIMLPKEQWLSHFGIRESRLERLRLALGKLLPNLFTTVFLISAGLNSKE